MYKDTENGRYAEAMWHKLVTESMIKGSANR